MQSGVIEGYSELVRCALLFLRHEKTPQPAFCTVLLRRVTHIPCTISAANTTVETNTTQLHTRECSFADFLSPHALLIRELDLPNSTSPAEKVCDLANADTLAQPTPCGWNLAVIPD